jgi:hypothetical protein
LAALTLSSTFDRKFSRAARATASLVLGLGGPCNGFRVFRLCGIEQRFHDFGFRV